VDNKRGEHRWRRIGDWPMALKLIVYTVGLVAALAGGLTAMGYIQGAQGLSERAEAALSADALVVTTAIDDWNAQRLSSIPIIARLPAVWRLLASEPDTMLVEDEQTAREGLSALDAPGEDVESVVIAAAHGGVVLSNRPEEIGSDARLQEDFRVAVAERRSFTSGVSMSASGDHEVIFHTAPILDASGRLLGAVRMRSSVAAIEHVVQLAED
jgi:hypothetical protein